MTTGELVYYGLCNVLALSINVGILIKFWMQQNSFLQKQKKNNEKYEIIHRIGLLFVIVIITAILFRIY